MTGFGAARAATPFGVFQVEIRSVNNRFLDVQIKGVGDLREWEPTARLILQQRVRRGKVDVYVGWERPVDLRPRVAIDRDLLNDLCDQVSQAAATLGATPFQLLSALPPAPGLISTQSPALDMDALSETLNGVLHEALDRHHEARAQEGLALSRDLLERSVALRECHQFIGEHRGEVVEKYRARLHEMISQLSAEARGALDPSRLEAEVAMFADRCDITEELTRLTAHLDQLDRMLEGPSDESLGKNLEFLVQELLRETNTIGSKGRDTAVIQVVLRMKNEIEKIREQVMNIE